jgi:hypothetical protein
MQVEIKEDWTGKFLYVFQTLPSGEWKVYRVSCSGGGQEVPIERVPRYVLELFITYVMQREDC